MAESWQARLQRQAREMAASLGALFPSTLDDRALLKEVEWLAQQPLFAAFTWWWGPPLAQRDRVLFRPFILAHFGAGALNAKGAGFNPWQGATAVPLEAWLQATDRADDVELTRRLYSWRLAQQPWRKREALWRAEVLRRFDAAPTPSARHTALAKVEVGFTTLDAATAVRLYAGDATAARPFILDHLPWFGWLGAKRADWTPLLQATAGVDAEFHFELYRRLVEAKQWRAEVVALCGAGHDAAALDAELERRHPRAPMDNAAEVFLALVEARGREVVPYLLRHTGCIAPRWGGLGGKDAKGLQRLLAFVDAQGWLDLWAALMRTSATAELFDAEVQRLVTLAARHPGEARGKLVRMAGHGREANFPGLSFAQVHPLKEETALALYACFPALLRGPYRLHVAPGWHSAYPRLVTAALQAHDEELVDFLASRVAMQFLNSEVGRDWRSTVEQLVAHYEALPPEAFVARAASALGRMPAFAIWSYDRLLQGNALARLLFERSTALFLSGDDRPVPSGSGTARPIHPSAAPSPDLTLSAVRDLLESPQIHVQLLALRILALDDPRARACGAAHCDLLQATLFRPLHRRSRMVAFAALANATAHDEATARYLLGRMGEACALPELRYPKEALVGLMGQVLHRWPALRVADEQPVVYAQGVRP